MSAQTSFSTSHKSFKTKLGSMPSTTSWRITHPIGNISFYSPEREVYFSPMLSSSRFGTLCVKLWMVLKELYRVMHACRLSRAFLMRWKRIVDRIVFTPAVRIRLERKKYVLNVLSDVIEDLRAHDSDHVVPGTSSTQAQNRGRTPR